VITTKVVLVTPDMARRWLAGMVLNRHLRKKDVRKIAADMRAGRWRVTHEAIAVGTDGRLIDGQHRLTALVAAGVSVEMLVASNVPADAMGVINTGSKRDARDTVIIAGLTDVRDHATWVRTALSVRGGDEPSPGDVAAYLPRIKPALDAMTPVLAGKRGGVRRAGLATAFVVAWHDPVLRESIATMARRYVENDSLTKWSGLWWARRRAEDGAPGGSAVMREDFMLALRCIEIERDGRTVKVVRGEPDLARWWSLMPPTGAVL